MDVTPTSVELHIGTLVLEGMSDGDTARIRYVMQRELSRLFTEQGVPEAWKGGGVIELVQAARVVPQAASPAAFGHQIAHAIYEGQTQ